MAMKRQLAGLALMAEGVFEMAQLYTALANLAGGRCDLNADVLSAIFHSAASVPEAAGGSRLIPAKSSSSDGSDVHTSSMSRMPASPALEYALSKSTFFFDAGFVEKQGRYTTGLVFQVCQ